MEGDEEKSPSSSWRKKHRGNKKGGGSSRHPPHLKGRQIGMFYQKRRKEELKALGLTRKMGWYFFKPVGTILLSDNKKQQIQTLLDNTQQNLKTSSDSNLNFHHQFQKIISGNIHDKLGAKAKLQQDVHKDAELYNDFQNTKQTGAYKRMMLTREKLPSYQKRFEIIRLIQENQVVVVSGETGCGKTTQVAQFILDDYLENLKGSVCNIVCTQPRRISAITVAERVASERGETLGQSTGYKIRLDQRPPRGKGSIVFCTTGVVLKQMEFDPNLSNVSHIILDEIHERDIPSDLLMGILKQVVEKRADLKLILMSATLNAEKFSKYFNGCPHINIPGFTYPVKQYYLEDVLERTGFEFNPYVRFPKERNTPEYLDLLNTHIRELEASKAYSPQVCNQLRLQTADDINLELIRTLLVNICETEKDKGAILVFLTGFTEISQLIKLLEDSGKFPKDKYLILPLHSIMPTVNQREIFNRPPAGIRKVIISTNIAETSITIDDVVFVIDCGKIKMSNYDFETDSATLRPEWVAQANASQRKGRAGRVQPGICFHLFNKARNLYLEQYQKPEILRTRIETTILMMKILQLGEAMPFLTKLMDCPHEETITRSLELLKRLEALDHEEKLTPLGFHLARLPIAPQMGKMLLLGAMLSCIDPVLAVAASLDFKEAFQMPIGKEKLVAMRKRELAGGCNSDHLLLHNALHKYECLPPNEVAQFCWRNFLSRQTLGQLSDMKKQLMGYLYEMDFVSSTEPKDEDCNMNSWNMSLVKAVVCAGLYPNVSTIRAKKRRRYRLDGPTGVLVETGGKINIHPKSVLFEEVSFESPLIVYYNKLRSSFDYIHDATVMHPLPLVFFGDNYRINTERDFTTVSIGNGRLRFKCSKTTSAIIKELRDRIDSILERKIVNPGFVDWRKTDDDDIAVLSAVMELITSEDIGDIDLDAFDDCDEETNNTHT